MLLLILLFVCHYLGDFTPLSNAWMQQAKQFGRPLFPILCHAAVHAFLMLIVLLFFIEPKIALSLSLFQCLAHFSIDVLKGKMNGWFPILQDASKKGYWMIFGFDQLLHQATILTMVGYLN